jgi:hypothetical protein
MNPRGHHLTNVVIHAISTVLLFLLLFRLTGSLWRSSFVAALFALHPLHVESVAWVAERKDVLSAFFWVLTLLLYAEYVAKRKPMLYLLTLFSFMLGLMSKPMLVTLPLVMLLLDFWPLNREILSEQIPGQRQIFGGAPTWLALVKEKIPFFACALFSAAVTIYAQHKGGAIKSFDVMPFGFRIENAVLAYVKYLSKTLWPIDLAVFYTALASHLLTPYSDPNIRSNCMGRTAPSLPYGGLDLVPRNPCACHRSCPGGWSVHGGPLHVYSPNRAFHHVRLGSYGPYEAPPIPARYPCSVCQCGDNCIGCANMAAAGLLAGQLFPLPTCPASYIR